jgi:hypothetical protein
MDGATEPHGWVYGVFWEALTTMRLAPNTQARL